MGRLALFVVTLLLVTGVLTGLVARSQPTIEEETFLKAYTDLSLARVYDEICQPQARTLSDDPQNADPDLLADTYFSSTNFLFEMRLERVMLARKPHLKEEGVKAKLEQLREATAADYRHRLAQEGCDSQIAQVGKKALAYYTTQHGGLIIIELEHIIRSKGGSIVPYVHMDKDAAT